MRLKSFDGMWCSIPGALEATTGRVLILRDLVARAQQIRGLAPVDRVLCDCRSTVHPNVDAGAPRDAPLSRLPPNAPSRQRGTISLMQWRTSCHIRPSIPRPGS
jgi:hypothetical protein